MSDNSGHQGDVPDPTSTSRPSNLPRNASGTSPPTTGTSVPLAIRSSAAFLHHLHTDPSSHHMTLAATSSREGVLGGALSPKSPSLGRALSDSSPSPVRRHSNRSGNEAAGMSPPGLSSPRGALSRRGSKRSQLGISVEPRPYPDAGPMQSQPRISSAEMDRSSSFEEHGDPESSESLPQISAEEFRDGCLIDFAQEQAAHGVPEAMAMLSLTSTNEVTAGGPVSPSYAVAPALTSPELEGISSRRGSTSSSFSTGSHLIGRAGTLGLQSASTSALGRVVPGVAERLDWRTFSKSYAHGLFDPNKIPNPPSALIEGVNATSSARSSPGRPDRPLRELPQASSRSYAPTTASVSGSSARTTTSAASGTSPATTAFSGTTPSSSGSVPSLTFSDKRSNSLAERQKAFEFESLPPATAKQGNQGPRPDKMALPSYNFAAATVRIASNNLRSSDLEPLGVPSPERELMDPLASFVSHPESRPALSASSDPGGARYGLSRSMSSTFDGGSGEPATLLPTIAASPVGTPNEAPPPHKPRGRAGGSPSAAPEYFSHRPGGNIPHRVPPASVPLERTAETATVTDYFGDLHSPPRFNRQQSHASQSSSSQTTTTVTATPNTQPQGHKDQSKSAEHSSIALPETSHTSPERAISVPSMPSVPQPSDIGRLYDELGWLPAPMPPQEMARRRALYRYNILQTANDANFDRVAHMAKLVFSTKIVLIALIDAEEQSHKAETGLNASTANRVSSFCSHSILSK